MNNLNLRLLTCCSLVFLFGNLSAQVNFTNSASLIGTVSSNTYSDCAVDMNGDYLDDIVRVSANAITIDYQQTNGTFNQVAYPGSFQALPSWSICAGDLNDDGFNDLLFGGGQAVSFILSTNNGTGFTEYHNPDYIFSQRSTMADIDNDGDLDAFVCHDVDQSHPYRNDGTGIMTEDQSLIQTIDLAGNYAAIWVDYDNDGDSDLYITKCRQGSSPGDAERTNAMYRNNGDGTYSEVGAECNMDDNAQSWATVFEDFDNDGDFDAFIVNHDDQNRFKLNNGDGTFSDIIGTTNINANDLGAWENASGDFDNDGFIDIFSELGSELYLNNGDLTFTGQDLPFRRGGIGDLNNDGFLDVISGQTLWLNEGNDNNWIKFNTQGIISNRNGIGTRIEIHGSWGVQVREVRAGQSFRPMSSLNVHFGIGTADAVTQVVVKWPSGVETILENPEINTTHLLVETNCLLEDSEITANGSPSLCPGESLTLEAPAGFDNYAWSNGQSNGSNTVTIDGPGSYSVVASNTDGCVSLSNSISVVLIEDETPVITVDGETTFCKGASVILSSSLGENYNWSNQMQTQSIEVTETGSYSVMIDAICSEEQLNSETIDITVLAVDEPVVSDDVIGGPGNNFVLTATGENLKWYDAPTGGNLLGQGESFTTPALSNNTSYYVEASKVFDGGTQAGGKLDNTGNGGLPTTGAHSYFDAYEAFEITQVTVYVPETAPTGIRTIQLVDNTGTILEETTFDLAPGTHILDLNFLVPNAGTQFSLRCPENNLFRNNNGVMYPYALGDVGEINGSVFGNQYYYYFYNWQVTKIGLTCVSDRVETSVSIVGVKDLGDYISGIQVFPNPSEDFCNVSYEAKKANTVQMRLLDIKGSEVVPTKNLVTQIGINTHKINLSNLAKGVYQLVLSTEDGVSHQKIVVQ